jgi:hypothetical protein
MKMATRDNLQAIKKEQFSLLGEIVDAAKVARAEYFTQLAAIDKLPRDFTVEYFTAKKAEAASKLAAKNQALYADTQVQLEKLRGALSELHGSLDITDPALTNAISFIKLVGSDLDFDDKVQINANLSGNQPALRLLKKVYSTLGVPDDGDLDRQIYDPESVLRALGQHAEAALVKGGLMPYQLGSEIGKVAKLENVDFPQGNPDPSESNGPFLPAEIDALKVRFRIPD